MSKSAFEKATDFIIEAGFSHIKIEMEADMGREDDEYECDECYGEGYVDCSACDGSGVVIAERPNGSDIEVECDECGGEGRIECEYCDGSGQRSGEEKWDTDTCEEWILNNVSDEARQALTYSKFYYDGSVDSEMTLTIPVKDAKYLTEYLTAFKALGDEIGHGVSTGGAGLHVAVIPACSNGYYPAPSGSLPVAKWNNFKREVTKLLPALFMLASVSDVSRPLNYRRPQVSSEEKYSAIFAYNRSCLEYRLFETCYDNPDMIKEYIEVIANTLRFYVDTNLKVTNLDKRFTLTDGENKVSRFYTTPDSIMILRNQLKYIKPEGKSVSELMKTRQVPNITELKKLQSAKKSQLRKTWYADKKRNEVVKKLPLTSEQLIRKDELMKYNNYTESDADCVVRGIRELQPLTDYINNRLSQSNGRYSPNYTLTV